MTLRPFVLVGAAVMVGAVGLAACGDDDTAAVGTESEPRVIEIEMRDIAFSPDEVDVRAGETVRFVFSNVGAVRHDAFIGDESAQDEHEMEMRGEGDMGDEGGEGHDAMGEEDGITVEPGETGELTHTFVEGDDVLIGCHEEGHYEAGMRVLIQVT